MLGWMVRGYQQEFNSGDSRSVLEEHHDFAIASPYFGNRGVEVNVPLGSDESGKSFPAISSSSAPINVVSDVATMWDVHAEAREDVCQFCSRYSHRR